jgi:integrase
MDARNHPWPGRKPLHDPGEPVTRRRVGDANPRGRLDRPEPLFRLAPGLMRPGAVSLDHAYQLVSADWARQVANGNVSAVLIETYERDIKGLVQTAKSAGLTELGELDRGLIYLWMHAKRRGSTSSAVGMNTRFRRRSAARSFLLTAQFLGLHDQNPALGIEELRRYEHYVLAFTDDQVAQIKRTCVYRLGETRVPAVIALVLSGATNGEVAYTQVRDIDQDNRRIWLHDGGHRSIARWVPVDDDWCWDALTKRIKALADDQFAPEDLDLRCLTYDGTTDNPTFAQRSAATSRILIAQLQRARVYRSGVTRPESLREWLAQHVYAESGSIERVAYRLGIASLDAAAHVVGYNWHQDLSPAPAPAWATSTRRSQ